MDVPDEFVRVCSLLAGDDDLLLVPGIARSIGQTYRPCVWAIATKENANAWIAEIERALQHLSRDARWWRGTSVGAASAAIFSVLSRSEFTGTAGHYSRGETPRDAGDFGRCRNLLSLFPEWRTDLARVAEAFPSSKWPAIIARWDELDALPPDGISRILTEIHSI
jgi:hypothetical protein